MARPPGPAAARTEGARVKEDMVVVGPEMAQAMRCLEGRRTIINQDPCRVIEVGLFTVTVIWEDPELEAEKAFQARLAKIDRMYARSKWFVRILYMLSAAFTLRQPFGWGWIGLVLPVAGWSFFEFYVWPRSARRRRELNA